MRCLSAWIEPGPVGKMRFRLDKRAALAAMILLTLAGMLLVMALPRIPQDPNYHRFVDQRPILGVPNGLNVISNLAFVAAGADGLRRLLRHGARGETTVFAARHESWPLISFYLGVILTGLGSAYYHWSPSNGTLVWDRLPMTIIFVSFLAALITERIHPRTGVLLLAPLLALGAVAVLYWAITEQSGAGDLRPYGFVHFHPVLLILLILWFFPTTRARDQGLLGVLALFALATGCEALDRQLFALAGVVSGHTLKHLVAGLAVHWHTRKVLMEASPEHREDAPSNPPPLKRHGG